MTPGPKKDLSGRRFGHVIALVCKGNNRRYNATMWLCQCDCGRQFTTQRSALLSGRTQTCRINGCAKRRRIIDARKRTVELPLIKVRWQQVEKPKPAKKPRPATKVRCRLQKVFANDRFIRKHQGRLTLADDARDNGQSHPFIDPDESLWIQKKIVQM